MMVQIIEMLNPQIYSIWNNIFFYLFILVTLLSVIAISILLKSLRNKIKESNLQQQQHIARINNVRKEHSITLENIRVEMLKREEERIRQWMESEKETLHVLNGVSTLLELSDKIDKVELKKIIKMLQSIETKITNGKN